MSRCVVFLAFLLSHVFASLTLKRSIKEIPKISSIVVNKKGVYVKPQGDFLTWYFYPIDENLVGFSVFDANVDLTTSEDGSVISKHSSDFDEVKLVCEGERDLVFTLRNGINDRIIVHPDGQRIALVTQIYSFYSFNNSLYSFRNLVTLVFVKFLLLLSIDKFADADRMIGQILIVMLLTFFMALRAIRIDGTRDALGRSIVQTFILDRLDSCLEYVQPPTENDASPDEGADILDIPTAISFEMKESKASDFKHTPDAIKEVFEGKDHSLTRRDLLQASNWKRVFPEQPVPESTLCIVKSPGSSTYAVCSYIQNELKEGKSSWTIDIYQER